MPYLWTDGLATWTYSDSSEIIHGGLGKTDFSFDFKSDPLTPLEVGGGQTITLVDEPSKRTRYLFSPDKISSWSGFTVASATGILSSATTIQVQDTTGLTGGLTGTAAEYLYLGQETVYVQSVDSSTQLTVARGRFGTTKMKHLNRFEGVVAGVRGTEISTLPTVWRGRFVDVYMATVEEDGTAGPRYAIWAGRLGNFTLTSKSIRLSCDNLTASFTKDDWPEPLPAIHTGGDTAWYYLSAAQMYVYLSYWVPAGVPVDNIKVAIGSYNYGGGAFTAWTTEGWYSIKQIAQAITDGLINYGFDANGLEVYWEQEALFVRNETTTTFVFQVNKGILHTIRVPAANAPVYVSSAPHTNVFLVSTPNYTGFYIGHDSDQARGFPLTRNDRLTAEGCKNFDGTMVGYVKISQESDAELASFSEAVTGPDGTTSIGFTERGMAGTKSRTWGIGTEYGPASERVASEVKLEQVMAISSGHPMDAADFLLYLLLSVDGTTSLNDTTYDKLGSRFGLGYHPDHVDIDGIKSRMAIGDMPRPYIWWVEQSGKGKEALEEFMQLHGVYFVTRRFERAGVYLFGLSVDVVDVPVPSRYNISVTDAFRKADTSVDVDINERLIINTVAVSPSYQFGQKESDAGGKVFAYAEDSINKYGASKSLDIKASAFFSSYLGLSNENAIAIAMADAIGLRWFGGFATGNFTLQMECLHNGWLVQSGDRALVTLTGVVNTNGEDGISAVAKVLDAKHTYGKSAGAKITFRISLARAAELVPCFDVNDVSDNPDILISLNTFSSSTADIPFDGDALPVKDVHWFQALKHADGSGLRCFIWIRGNFASREEVVVSTTNISTSTLTLSAPLGATLFDAFTDDGATLVGSFIDYDDPTILMSTYAYIGSNDVQSKLGTQDVSTADVEAFEWV